MTEPPAEPPKKKTRRVLPATVVTSPGGTDRVHADRVSPGGTVVGRDRLEATPKKSFLGSLGNSIRDVWHSVTGMGASAETLEADHLRNEQADRDARRRRKKDPPPTCSRGHGGQGAANGG